ncbi:MAG TPA: DUF6159 family protein [Acidimicrobiia bacterium]|nr:DUF6159 family protein [Acidimicrobiia bacterium]
MQRIRNSWELGKISWSVLRSDKTLAAFPVFAAIGALVVFGVFGGLTALTGVNTTGGKEGLEAIGYVFIVVGYVALAFVTTYFQAGLVSGANEVLDGRNATIRTSLDAANSKLHRILPWAILSATVSIIISAIEERAGFVGQIISSILGAAWAVVTFLTIPVIMLEDLGPWNALKRSGTLLKQTWGENLAAQFGFGILGFVAVLPAIALIAGGIATGSLVVAIVLGTIGVVWLIAVSVVISAMSGIYRTALYRFTVDGAAPSAFADADLGHAFGHRKGRGRTV